MNKKLLRIGSASFLIQISIILLGFSSNVLFARLLGVQEYGTYSFVYSLVTLFSIPVQVGLPTLVLRETTKLHAEASHSKLRGLWVWATQIIIVGSLCAAFLLYLSAGTIDAQNSKTIKLAATLIPFLALGAVYSAALKGLHFVILGQLPEPIVRPLLLIVLGTIVWVLFDEITAYSLTLMHLVAALFAMFFAASFLYTKSPPPVYHCATDLTQRSIWIKSLVPLGMVSAIQIFNLNFGVILLGILATHEEVAIFKIAVMFSTLLIFGRTAIQAITQPKMARLFHAGDIPSLQKLASDLALLSSLFTVLFLFAFYFLGDFLIQFALGKTYSGVWELTLILAGGQLVNSFFAGVGATLLMTGHERYAMRTLLIVTFCSFPVYFLLIYFNGMVGCAIAMSITVAVLHVAHWFVAKKAIGVDCSPINSLYRFLGKIDA